MIKNGAELPSQIPPQFFMPFTGRMQPILSEATRHGAGDIEVVQSHLDSTLFTDTIKN